MVRPSEPRISWTDVSDSRFDLAAPTSDEEAQKKKWALKSSLTAAPENWWFSILHCRFLFR